MSTIHLLEDLQTIHEDSFRLKEKVLWNVFEIMRCDLRDVITRRDCLRGGMRLKEKFQTFLTELKVDIVWLKTHLEISVEKMKDRLTEVKKQTETLSSFEAEFNYVDTFEQTEINNWTGAIEEVLDQWKETLLFYDQEVEMGFECVLQSETQLVLAGLGEEKDRVWRERVWRDLGWANHMGGGENNRPDVCLTEKRVRVVLGSEEDGKTNQSYLRHSPYLPLEVKAIIYSLSDLSSSAVLRQVDKSWYEAFQQLDHIWKPLLTLRNPWITPKTLHTSSWADCVLVFTARLKTWSTVDNLDKISVPDTPATMKAVVCIPLDPDETLPPSFQPLCAHSTKYNCHSQVCEHLHTRGAEGIMDLGKGDFTPDGPQNSKPEFLGLKQDLYGDSNFSDQVFRFKNVTFRLPPEIDKEDISFCLLAPSTLAVFTYGSLDVSLMSRDKPHFLDEIYLSNVLESQLFLFEDVQLVLAQGDSGTWSYSICDFDKQKVRPYCSESRDRDPVAAYNGSIWWSIEQKCLVPTMIDLETPGKVLYSRDKAVRMPKQSKFTQGSKTSGSKRFVCGTGKEAGKSVVVDLETGIVSQLTLPDSAGEEKVTISNEKDNLPRVIPGFQNGQFYPRCMSKETVDKWIDKAYEARGWDRHRYDVFQEGQPRVVRRG